MGHDVGRGAKKLLALFDLENDRSEAAFARACQRFSHLGSDAGDDIFSSDQRPLRNALRGLQYLLMIADAARSQPPSVASPFSPGLLALVTGLADTFKSSFDLTKCTRAKCEEKLQLFGKFFCRELSCKLACGDLRLAMLLNRWGAEFGFADQRSELVTCLAATRVNRKRRRAPKPTA